MRPSPQSPSPSCSTRSKPRATPAATISWFATTALLATLTSACPETAELARVVGTFAQLLTLEKGNDARLTEWIAGVRAADLPHLHSFCNGLELDRAAVNAGLTLPHHNGRTEGRQHPHQTDHEADAWPSRIRPPPPPHPPVVTTEHHHRLRNRAKRTV